MRFQKRGKEIVPIHIANGVSSSLTIPIQIARKFGIDKRRHYDQTDGDCAIMGSEKLDKIIDNTESLLSNLLHHVHSCDHTCCVKDVLRRIYEND